MLRALLIVLALAASAAPLRAQGAGTQSFEELMELGLAHREAGRDNEALVEFEKCLEQRPGSGHAIGQVALAEMALGRLVLAESHLAEALAQSDDAWVRRHRQVLESARAELGVRIATVEIPFQGAHITFEESGRTLTRLTPVTLRLSPGVHQFRVEAPGFAPSLTSLTLFPGQHIVHVPPRAPSAVPIALAPTTVILEEQDPYDDRYLIRSIRLDVVAAIFAGTSIGTGIGARLTRSDADFFDERDPRSAANRFFVATAVSSAVVGVVLFVAARVARRRHRRELSPPSF